MRAREQGQWGTQARNIDAVLGGVRQPQTGRPNTTQVLLHHARDRPEPRFSAAGNRIASIGPWPRIFSLHGPELASRINAMVVGWA
jgi:hypothetical protein